MFRRRPAGSRRRESNEARLRALGVLLDRRGYQPEGLCLLEVNGGFEITGLTIPERGAAYDLAQRSKQISVAELDVTTKQLMESRDKPPSNRGHRYTCGVRGGP